MGFFLCMNRIAKLCFFDKKGMMLNVHHPCFGVYPNRLMEFKKDLYYVLLSSKALFFLRNKFTRVDSKKGMMLKVYGPCISVCPNGLIEYKKDLYFVLV